MGDLLERLYRLDTLVELLSLSIAAAKREGKTGHITKTVEQTQSYQYYAYAVQTASIRIMYLLSTC